uniref:Uncharacterized protein n=1 Tax=Sparus aurata TaxID=8175 RepID=A0A671XGK2_SPAAU
FFKSQMHPHCVWGVFTPVSQLCVQGYTVCNGVFLEDESLLICQISCPYLHIWETA